MNILGLYWGLCSTVALFQENDLTSAVSEERFSRLKNDDAFPLKSINYCLSSLPGGSMDLDGIAIASYTQGYWYSLKRKARWSIDDYVKEQREFWYPVLIEGKKVLPADFLRDHIDTNQYPDSFWQASLSNSELVETFDERQRANIVSKAVGVDTSKIHLIEHHRCHAYYAYYANQFRSRPILALTIDGWGDGCNATINIFDETGKYKRVYTSKEANIGRIYRYITLLLGMKPNEHEYKVMGLAPYAKESVAKKAYEVFKSTLYVDGIDFKWYEKPTDSYFWFKDKLEGCRFDGIAAGMQRWAEELLCDWVGNAVKEFGIKDVILSGGVAMNIKANGEIAKLSDIDSFFVPGSATDESLALGAAYALAEDLSHETNGRWNACNVKSLHNINLGPNATLEEESALISEIDESKYTVAKNYGTSDVAKALAEGKIVARCAGKMEFGQRSLGNRSILADPINLSVVPKINAAIKNRDFWMPFAPIMLDSWSEKYIVNPKRLSSPFMTLAFETTELGWSSLPAGCHQSDHSARAQILTKESNPDLYKLLEAFADITGRGSLLNTSFNLHGFPIVNTPRDAMSVFENSGLDILVLNHYMIEKRNS